MTYTFSSKKVARIALATTLILAIMIVALLAKLIPPNYYDNNLWLIYIIISCSIISISCFLPESKVKEFASRQSAVSGGCLFLYLALFDIFQDNNILHEGMTVILLALVSFLSYYTILSLIKYLKTDKLANKSE